MDIRCRKCGEAWDHDCLHEAAEEQGKTYDAVAADFRKRGCIAFGWGAASCENAAQVAHDDDDGTGPLPAHLAAATLYDLLGDDMDGAAAMLEDMGY